MSFPSAHALVIGVGSYTNRPSMDVLATAYDATEVAGVLADPRHCGYPKDRVTLLHDGSATRSGILGALDALAQRASPEDTVFVFFSGHGELAGETYYLPVHDTAYTPDGPTLATVITEQELLDRLRAIPARRMLLVFNTCHAGAFSPTLGDAAPDAGRPLPGGTAAALLSTGEGRIIITACRESQVSYVGPGPQTIVGRALAGALRGEGVRGEAGAISAYDLYLAVYRQVGDLVRAEVAESLRRRHGETQEPELTVLKGVGPFAVALYRGAATLGGGGDTPPPDGAAVRQVEPEVSRRAYHAIVNRGVDFGQGNTVSVGGSVTGTDQRVTIIRGDSAGGNIDSRQGVFFEGGSTNVGGTVIGVANEAVTIGSGSAAPAPALAVALAQALQAAGAARRRGDGDLADDLDGVVASLRAALKAEGEGKADRRDAKIQEAAEDLRRLAAGGADLTAVLEAVGKVR